MLLQHRMGTFLLNQLLQLSSTLEKVEEAIMPIALAVNASSSSRGLVRMPAVKADNLPEAVEFTIGTSRVTPTIVISAMGQGPKARIMLVDVPRDARSSSSEVEMGSSGHQAGTLSPSARGKPRWLFLALFASPVLSPITSGVRATCTRCRPGPTCARSAPGSTRSPVPPSARRQGRSREAELVMLVPEIT